MDKHDIELVNDPEFLAALRENLKAGHSFSLIFHGIKKDHVEQAEFAEALLEAKKIFMTDCPALVSLKKEFPDRVHIFWTSSRLHDHCVILADKMVFREDSNHPKNKYPGIITFTEEKLVKAWAGYADHIIEFPWVKELDFEESLPTVEATV